MTDVRESSVEVRATVKMTVGDEHGVFGRYIEGGEDHGTHPYGLRTRDEILRHLMHNAVANGVYRINRLDGWADLEDHAATFVVEGVEVDHGN